ncbi:MAG: hypothetical protein J6A63_02615 [Clostridia bacterium]|nr:hypothetical protein [Clostridia bacterium]
MKQRTKVMLSSLAAIAMSASLAVGATYALFTSETQVDISVSSGSVNVDATAKNLELYSRGLKQDGGTFEVGGTATLVENVITIERMVPMDSVKFDIVIENYSDVSVQYRTIVKELEDTGLFPALKVSFTGRETNKAEFEGASSYSDWELVNPQDTDPTTAEHIQTVGVTIDFPDGEDQNKYQNTSCKLVVIVEAVQANADVHSGVAKIGDTAYETLEEALAMAQPNDVVEMLHPGVYAPFTVNTQGVTVKGIVGENKLESTVFQVTGDNMINLMASGTTIDGLWVEVMDGSADWRAGAFNIVQSWGTGTVSDDVTITNSKIYGNDKLNFVLLCCNDTFTFTNNYVDGFPTAISSMCDNSVAVLYTITGNTTNNVTSLLDGYWGMATTTGNPNIVVNNNVANDETLIRLWDYTYVRDAATSINAEVKGNTNATLKLTRNTDLAVVDTDETDIIYQNAITLSNFADGKYTVTNLDGTAVAYDDSKEVTIVGGTVINPANNKQSWLIVSTGNYKLESADYVYEFAVGQNTFAIDANNVFGMQYVSNGLYKDANGYYVTTAEGLQTLNGMFQSSYDYSKTVTLLNDIDMNGAAWTEVGKSGKYPKVFDGNNKTISNMLINGRAMFNRIYDNKVMTIQNLTLDNVTVNTTKSNAAVLVGELFNNLTLDNVDVKNSAISGETKVATLVGSVNNSDKSWAITLTVKNCDLENITVTGNPNDKKEERLAGMVAWVADKFSNDKIVLENNTMKNVNIISNAEQSEHHALIYISDVSATSRYGVYHNTDAGVTVTNCTYVSPEGFAMGANNTYYVSADKADILTAVVKSVSKSDESVVELTAGTYSEDLNLTLAAIGEQKGDLVFKAAEGEKVVLTGLTTLGLYKYGTTNLAKWSANVTFENIIFDQAQAKTHSIHLQQVNCLTLKNCTIIGDGEYGITSEKQTPIGSHNIIGCTFENAAIQILGNFGTNLLIDGCTFNNSRVNAQNGAGNGVTVQNCTFNATLTDANVDESFYLVRGSANGGGIPVTIKNCKMNIDSTVTGIAASQASWGAIWNRGATIAWTLENVEITVTVAAQAQTELKIIKTAGGAMNMTNVTLNGVQQ